MTGDRKGSIETTVLPAALTFVVGFALTLFGTFETNRYYSAQAQIRFDQLATRMVNEVDYRMRRPRQGLNAIRGLYAASVAVSRDEFRAFIASRDLDVEFPGILGFGFIRHVARTDLDAFVAAERADGAPDFQVLTSGDAPDLYPIVYAEPFAQNREGWGADAGSETNGRAAIETAVRTGQPTLTAALQLSRDNTPSNGFLYLAPVYRNGSDPQTPEQRQAELVGLAFAALVIDDVFDDLLAEADSMLDVEVYDGDRPSEAGLLFDADNELVGVAGDGSPYGGRRFAQTVPLSIGGRGWTLVLTSTERFDSSIERAPVYWFAAGGLLISSLLSGMVYVLGRSRVRALSLAEQMTSSLRASEAEAKRLAMVASRTNNGVVITDADRRIEWVNEGFTRITGYTLSEVKGHKPGTILQGPRTGRTAIEKMREGLRSGDGFQVELVNYHKSGRPYWVAVEVQPLRNDAGAIVGWMGIESDITERKTAADELTASEQRLSDLTAQAPGAIFQFEVAPDGKRRFAFLSDGFRELFGRDPAKALARPEILFAYVHADDRERVRNGIEEAIRENRPWIDSYRILLPDDSIRWINARSTLKTQPDGVKSWFGVLADISELQHARVAAEKANAAKSQFLAMMSHEIRTPMNGVIGMTSLLLDTHLNERQREFAEVVRTSGESLLSLINDILDFSKIESGRMELEDEPFGLRECAESALDLFAMKAAQKEIELILDIADSVPERIRGDTTRLRQILVNLIGNAVKFTEKGEIEINVAGSPRTDGTVELAFSVRDTGIGIPSDAIGRLFSSFTQVDASTTRKYGGTGLGLAISRRLAEIMNGRMWVDSVPGRGSTFHFTIRATPVPGELPPSRFASALPRLRGRRLLIVDPNATSQRLLAALVEKWGMKGSIESDPRHALARMQSGERYDLALVENRMPLVDGTGFARQAHSIPDLRNFPIVLLSTVGSEAVTGRADQFAAVVSKPVKPSPLLDAIANALGCEVAPPAPLPKLGSENGEGQSRSHRILLAEDNPVNQKVALHMLMRLGLRADTAANGVEVLAALERQEYDIILMDVQMPEMDGVETTRHIRKSQVPGGKAPWIVALTANAMQGDRETYMRQGMDDYLSKPLKLSDLANAVKRAQESILGAEI